jgi:hypothetical protein
MPTTRATSDIQDAQTGPKCQGFHCVVEQALRVTQRGVQ